jgi:Fic family protein
MMPDEKHEPNSATPTATLEQLDADYRPFPAFAEWSRESAVDLPLWSTFAARLEDARAQAPADAVERAVDIAVRSAALETGAIEGLYPTGRGITYSVATQAAAWQSQLEAEGGDIRGHFDAQLSAYELVLDAATQKYPITASFIRNLHEVVTGNQETYVAQTPQGPQEQTLPKAQYKTLPNHVIKRDGTPHSYAPVADTPPEMARLIDELRSEAFANAILSSRPPTSTTHLSPCILLRTATDA